MGFRPLLLGPRLASLRAAPASSQPRIIEPASQGMAVMKQRASKVLPCISTGPSTNQQRDYCHQAGHLSDPHLEPSVVLGMFLSPAEMGPNI